MKTRIRKPRKPQELPDKPSELIRLALKDLARVKRDPRYSVDMGTWHGLDLRGKCHVCLAGAVMACRLPTDPSRSFHPENFSLGIEDKLRALDQFRQGKMNRALEHLGVYDSPVADREVTPHAVSPRRFRSDMLKLAKELEEVGL